jgi:methylglutaconyl-CoA hydratase
MSDEVVTLEVERGIATITLNSPGNRNALSGALRSGLAARLAEAAADSAVRAVVLTGAGPVFCAGADLKEVGQADAPVAPALPEILTALTDLPKPVVAKLNGPARAGGLGLVAACDIALAPDDVTFAFTEVRIGVAPAMIAVVCCPRMTPRALSRYFLTGEKFSAAEAVEVGLLTATAPREALDSLTDTILNGFRAAEPTALSATKRLLTDLPTLNRAEAFAHAQEISQQFFGSPEAAEGIRAFFEKRRPTWDITR